MERYNQYKNVKVQDDLTIFIFDYLQKGGGYEKHPEISSDFALYNLSKEQWHQIYLDTIEWLNDQKKYIDKLERGKGAPEKWNSLYYLILTVKEKTTNDWDNLYEMSPDEILILSDTSISWLKQFEL